MATPRVINIRGFTITEIFPAEESREEVFVKGNDEFGKFIAYRLNNKERSPFFGWYILVSPEDLNLMKRHNWCANCNNRGIEIRRKISINGEQICFSLTQDIWREMTGETPKRVYRCAPHVLDFRRRHLTAIPPHKERRGVTWIKSCWQVQISLPNRPNVYIGIASTDIEGYRLYNQYLSILKTLHPEDAGIQRMPYNKLNE